MNQKQTGNRGEDLTATYLEKQGYRIVARNLRLGYREIDILAYDKNELVVVEVKTSYQSEPDLGFLISKKKQNHLVQAIDQYVESHQLDVEVRFDVVVVLLQGNQHRITHIKEAFYA